MSIVRLEEAKNPALFGGKAVNLGILLRANLPVPKGLAIGINSFTKSGELSVASRTEINQLLTSGKKYAVRSSATVEDAAEASWAGQFESYLNVGPQDVIKQIEVCHTAVKTRADAYAAEQGGQKALVANVAVVVQEMVDARYAGVMFTKNPSDGKNQIIIEYVHGLGEALVHGDADPERVVWQRSRRAIKEQTETTTPFELKELIRLAEKVEEVFGRIPQDIEWAHSGKQAWLVQSRPITTLQERGSGKHYLGDPGNLFYWGPSRAVPLFMGDFLQAAQQLFTDLASDEGAPKPPKTIVLFHGAQVVWLSKQKDFNDFVTAMFRAYEKTQSLNHDISNFMHATQSLDAYLKNAKQLDIQRFQTLLTSCWNATLRAEFSLYGAEAVLLERLDRFNDKDRHDIWGIMTLPDKPTFLQRIDLELARTKDSAKLARQYPWVQNGYHGVTNNAETYFKQRLGVVGDTVELQAGSPEKRAAIIKKYGLKKSEISALNLARESSVFMDDRKAWMMRSRVYLVKLAQQLARELGKSVDELYATTLERLGRQELKPYFGWSYLKGQNVELTMEDVDLAWDWYVEFRASKTVLKGLIASSGGRHFINGEVFVARSHTDPMPDDAVLVVASTSPTYVPLMRRARALITDHGGMMSHAAIVAREFGLPCIVGTKRATKILKTGDKVVLDLVKGEVNK